MPTQIETTKMDDDSKRMMIEKLQPSREEFGGDPFGYAANAWAQWVIGMQLHGFGSQLDPENPTSENLKQPLLWLMQSNALSLAAITVIESEQGYENYQPFMRGIVDSQFRGVGLMLIGYSLEVALKGMTILRDGVDTYLEREKKRDTFTHDLVKLAEFIPDLNEKEKAILKQFTQFLTWAGRYPDPGFNRMDNAEDIHKTSEKYEITMSDLLRLADKIKKHVVVILGENDDAA